MILILGNNKDDLLYFETRLNDKKVEKIFNKYKVTIGNISNQSVILLHDVYTNTLSATLVSYLIEKYYVLFVIKVGKCHTISPTLNPGDVVLSKKIMAMDIDVCDISGTSLGQIPSFPKNFETNVDLLKLASSSFSKCSKVQTYSLTFMSSNKHFSSIDMLKNYVHDDMIFNQNIKDVVFDSELYGVALACNLHGIPFIGINVVLGKVGADFSTNNYIKVLRQYVNVGKSVVNIIGEMGSKEVLRD